ncbi:diguanylate cyclase domain-containing protein [Pararobbsia silviterrae]|uniref:Diguanylate cyclase n=1 Tax=Pararobbsia silviterrae TaxID=1792498 RepID=A0A494XUM0_9BURK|nr:diguanylate cyclase [Pararobbsia silviterrae]RKP51769.1 diguanylate cyclase [Pararobbsia silviterrae]
MNQDTTSASVLRQGGSVPAEQGRDTSLRGVLRRTYARFAVLAISTAAIPLILVAWMALRAYADDNLHLVARSLAYTAEAAVVFGDNAAAHDAIAQIAPLEDVDHVRVTDLHHRPLAQWDDTSRGSIPFLTRLASLALPPPVVLPITHGGAVVGYLEVHGRGRQFALFVWGGVAGVLGCVLVTICVGGLIAKRMHGDIVAPLRELADVAYAVRRERSFDRRVGPTPIVELRELGDDFNALLDELEIWQHSLREQNATLSHQANHDALTGLPNRAYFEFLLHDAIEKARAGNRKIAVLYIDSNRFKEINDTLGHDAGDAVLVATAMRLRGPLRRGDVVARLGGDEFAVMLDDMQDGTAAFDVAKALLDATRAPIPLPDGSSVATSISLGIAWFPDHGGDVASLLRAADTAMYRAKRAGDGAWRVVDIEDAA